MRTAQLALLLGAGLSLPGCFDLYEFILAVLDNINFNKAAVTAKPPRVDDFSIYAPPDVAIPNYRIRALPAELIAPFRVEQTAGLCDPAFAPGAQAVFGLAVKIRTPALDGDEFGIACTNTGAGIDVTVDFTETGSLSFPGAERVDIAFEHTGTDLVAFARAHAEDGAPETAWQEIERTTALAEAVVFLPQVEVFDLNPGEMVSFYWFDVPFNGEYPQDAATAEHLAVRAMVEATIAMSRGLAEIEEGGADPDEVRACLVDAGERIDASRDVLQNAAKVARAKSATAEEKLLKKADKKARAAEKKTDKALAILDKKGVAKARQIEKNLGKAVKSLLQAGDRVIPEDLREAIGGDTFKTFRDN